MQVAVISTYLLGKVTFGVINVSGLHAELMTVLTCDVDILPYAGAPLVGSAGPGIPFPCHHPVGILYRVRPSRSGHWNTRGTVPLPGCGPPASATHPPKFAMRLIASRRTLYVLPR